MHHLCPCVQHAGRPARGPDTAHGQAIVYIKKSSIDTAMEYVASEPPDTRMLTEKGVECTMDPNEDNTMEWIMRAMMLLLL